MEMVEIKHMDGAGHYTNFDETCNSGEIRISFGLIILCNRYTLVVMLWFTFTAPHCCAGCNKGRKS